MDSDDHKFKDTTATRKIFALTKRIRAVCGGTSASKTISILVWCIDYAQSNKDKLISVVSESYPHLLGGAMLDFQNIMKSQGYWKDSAWVKNPRTQYTFETGSKIEFVSIDEYGKAHGPRRDVLFVNEANNLEYGIVDQLIIRTNEIVWLDWNPTSEFWFYTEMKDRRDDLDFITLTYLDNEAIPDVIKQDIEAHKDRKDWWQVYGLGQLGEIEGKIYRNWKVIKDIPHEARLEGYGLDFGYHPDPAAIVAVYYYNGGYILDELLYQKGQSNQDLATFLKNQQPKLVIADSAEPKSIAEIASYGVNIIGVDKGQDSKRYGIQLVQDQQISVTERSINLIKEQRNYVWRVDKNGHVFIGETDPRCADHALDAARYKLTSTIPIMQKRQFREIAGWNYKNYGERKNPAR